jgi:translation initiation factor IF-2
MSAVLAELPSDEVQLKLAHAGVGPVVRSDVDKAIAAQCSTIWAFNVGVSGGDVTAAARAHGIEIRKHDVIYRFQEEVSDALEAHLPPKISAKSLGRAEVAEVYRTNGPHRSTVVVAGCKVTEGELKAGQAFRVLRDGEIVHSCPKVGTMRHFKERVSEIKKGQECGITLDNFADFELGDVIETYELKKVKRKLGDAR